MISLFLAHSLSKLSTFHIGEPKLAEESDGGLLLYTKDQYLAWWEDKNVKLLTFRLKIPGITYITKNKHIVAVSEQYIYIVKNETGHISNQILHNVSKVSSAHIYNTTIVLKGQNEIALYNVSGKIWSIESGVEEGDIRFNADGSKITYGTKTYATETGLLLDEVAKPFIPKAPHLKYQPTALEYYAENGTLLWTRETPLYGAKLHNFVNKHQILFTNATHIIILNSFDGKVHSTIPAVTKSVQPYDEDKFLIETTEGFFIFEDMKLVPFTKRVKTADLSNNILHFGNKTIIPPPNCQIVCTQVHQGPTPSILSVSQCPKSTQVLIIDEHGKIITNFETERLFGHCFQTKESFHISTYMNNLREKPHLISFSKNNSKNFIFNTPQVAIDATDDYILYKTGRIEKIRSEEIRYQPAPHQMPGFFQTFMHPEYSIPKQDPLEPQSLTITSLYVGAEKIASKKDICFAQGYDIFAVGLDDDFDFSTNYYIIILFLILILYIAYKHYQNKIDFWK
ncbi:hypothetical protein TVAG_205410 [Trichomonas vaginalis G3]|uniref:ER membrane protein complex subunit 1 n=1 Tax=Trichomonas vaginalis (strain ATCC PRA-98 / G3) TaxID=412133 RepID=A2FFS0_TRIV3|nr:hypothetical protein TVAGG3_0488890 [Trichomonas vaginalis G3]EAX96254.1 hypothetical protein TVAG_205410 [Trichomonas vaginalis G3]KAI5516237.1 hypothetical protein TVAGG3_0488890 [Trichomonas vaginalis G3]|eukprot:XP_001309184.1 hypothetical protein [Trichomonas vaginalis G3]